MKRIFDFCLALFGLTISLPLWLIFIFLIWLESGCPVFYLQERVGKGGRIFRSIKFRSMVPEAERGLGPVQAEERDQRVTKLGTILRRTAMDELPQLINILKGEMSFVGPRALRPQEKERGEGLSRSVFEFADFKIRCAVRPGLTGIAQVFAPRDISRPKKFKYDIWYMQNQNFFLDVYIIILSFWVTFKARWEARGDKFGTLARGLRVKLEDEFKDTGLS